MSTSIVVESAPPFAPISATRAGRTVTQERALARARQELMGWLTERG